MLSESCDIKFRVACGTAAEMPNAGLELTHRIAHQRQQEGRGGRTEGYRQAARGDQADRREDWTQGTTLLPIHD